MGAFIDLTGQQFGCLRVLGRSAKRQCGKVCWDVECVSAEHAAPVRKVVIGNSLVRGNTTSCGCLSSRQTADRNRANGTTFAPGDVNSHGVKLLRPAGQYRWWSLCPICETEFNALVHRVMGDDIRHCSRHVGDSIAAAKRSQVRKYSVWARQVTMRELVALSGRKTGTIATRMRRGMSAEEAAFAPMNYTVGRVDAVSLVVIESPKAVSAKTVQIALVGRGTVMSLSAVNIALSKGVRSAVLRRVGRGLYAAPLPTKDAASPPAPAPPRRRSSLPTSETINKATNPPPRTTAHDTREHPGTPPVLSVLHCDRADNQAHE